MSLVGISETLTSMEVDRQHLKFRDSDNRVSAKMEGKDRAECVLALLKTYRDRDGEAGRCRRAPVLYLPLCILPYRTVLWPHMLKMLTNRR